MYEKANEFYADAFKIEILCTAQAIEELLPLLRHIQAQGSVGHTANIVVDPENKERSAGFCFDGDGASKIQEIKIKQLHWHECFNINTHKGMMEKDGCYWRTVEGTDLKKLFNENPNKCLVAKGGCACEKEKS